MPSTNNNYLKEFYIHTSIHLKQSSKRTGDSCGDVFDSYRDASSTTLVLCDGLGSGLKANIYANMCCSRLIHLIKQGASIKKAFELVGKTMNDAWGKNTPFSVFTIARILNNGNTTIISYDMPPVVHISEGYASIIEGKISMWKKAVVYEASLHLKKNEGIVLLSDGITQAGLGRGLVNGWEAKGVANFLNFWMEDPKPDPDLLVKAIHQQAKGILGTEKGDDCSVAMAYNRKGITANILSGTPANIEDDEKFVNDFLSSEGIKIVSGGSTAKMLSRITKRPIEITDSGSSITPPIFKIKGITLATEGVVTLNQVFNILNENIDTDSDDSPVFEFADYLNVADKVIFWTGSSLNKEVEITELKQQGIRSRQVVVELITEKLQDKNKLVIINTK